MDGLSFGTGIIGPQVGVRNERQHRWAPIRHSLGFASSPQPPHWPGPSRDANSLVRPRDKLILKSRNTVFVAYHRDGGVELAWLVRDTLRERGYDVCMDIEALRSGLFDAAALTAIESSTDVVVVLSPDSLEPCARDSDWFCKSIGHVISCGKNVIPLIAGGFRWPSCTLPDEIAVLPSLRRVVLGHDFCTAGVERLSSLLVGGPKRRYLRYARLASLPVAAMILLIALFAGPIGTQLLPNGTAGQVSEQIESVVKEALDSVKLDERTVQFTGYEDRDLNGLYLAQIGAPTRTEFKSRNDRQVWNVFLGYLKGREIAPLVVALSKATSEVEKIRALAMLRQSMAANQDTQLDETLVSVAVGYVGQGTAVQDAALSLVTASRLGAKQQWDLVSVRLKAASDEDVGSAYRAIWQWIPEEERGNACNDLFRGFVRTRSEWAAGDLAYAIRKLDCAELMPAVREELSNTLNPRKAWYLARLVEDYEDRDAAPSLRAAFSRHYRYTLYAAEIAEILLRIEGDAAVPFVVATSLGGSEELLIDMAKDHVIGNASIRKGLDVVMKTGTAHERVRAREALRRLDSPR